jgi:CDP-diacylglycerol--glycerol-3-phosphate 3-phosphatidyltransferase
MLRASGVMESVLHPHVKALTQKLDQISPRFELGQGQVEIIQNPKEFYATLKQNISTAEKRIFLSSLYIGKTQDELIECVAAALRAKPDLKVSILTDALRGTREAPSQSSASLLARLMKDHESQVDIRMYHTPHLHGLSKSLVPNRFNEGFGLQHMKIYGFDEEVILSGANLSSDYFHNRQDRYYVFKSKELTDYYQKIQSTIGSMSYKVVYSDNTSKFKLIWPSSNPLPNPTKDWKSFVSKSSSILEELLKLKRNQSNVGINQGLTYVYPVSQFTPLFAKDHSTEKKSVLTLLDFLKDASINWHFTAGYFNMLPEIKRKLLQLQSKGTVITASPLANGFYKSTGVSGWLPDAYLYLSKVFLRDVHKAKRDSSIQLREWKRGTVNTEGGWSYHAKGLWATAPDEQSPSITIIGSSNYTRRAYSFDLESNAIVITRDPELKRKMKEEIENIMEHTSELKLEDFKQKDRKIPKHIVWATKILGKRL